MGFDQVDYATVQDAIYRFKRSNHKTYGNIPTLSMGDHKGSFGLIECPEGLVIIRDEGWKRNAYFLVSSLDELDGVLSCLGEGDIVEYQYREEDDTKRRLDENRLSSYACFIRITSKFETNPYLENGAGWKRILNRMYDPGIFEIATDSDVELLKKITDHTFDPICYGRVSDAEWDTIIREKRCLVVRDDDGIESFYVWRLEGKKLYGELGYNRGMAINLYSMERWVFEKAWKKGIRVYYGWMDVNNDMARKRSMLEETNGRVEYHTLYNMIYKK